MCGSGSFISTFSASRTSTPAHPDVLTGLAETGAVYLGYGPQAVRYNDIRHDIDAVMLRAETFTAEMITGSPKLKIIARHGVGSDNVDIPAARRTAPSAAVSEACRICRHRT